MLNAIFFWLIVLFLLGVVWEFLKTVLDIIVTTCGYVSRLYSRLR